MSFDRSDSADSQRSDLSQHADQPTEETPLLYREEDDQEEDTNANGIALAEATSARQQSTVPYIRRRKHRLKRWPSLLALLTLSVLIIFILVIAFVMPQLLEDYASKALTFETTGLSISSLTKSGVVARVQGDFMLNSSRIRNRNTRDLGKFGTWIVKEVQNKPTTVQVTFPEYGSPLAGTADVPPLKVNVRDKHVTGLDFETELKPGDKEAMRRVADDWIRGKLDQLRVRAKADVQLKSGIFKFPKRTMTQELVFKEKEAPAMPDFKISKLNVHEKTSPEGDTGLAADVSIVVENDYPIDVRVPPLGFSVLVPNCGPDDPHIAIANASTATIHIKPKQSVTVNATGFIQQLPDAARTACPSSHKSPLDLVLGDYLHGRETTVYVRTSKSPSEDTPHWVDELISGITVAVPFPGRSFGHLIKNFTMEDLHFQLPDLFAGPDTPESKPRISGTVKALIDLPDEINFKLDVNRVRSDADLYYKDDKFAELDLKKWQDATSRRVETSDGHSDLEVQAVVDKAPLTVTDDKVFRAVVAAMLTGEKGLTLTMKADVDVDIETALGELVVRKIPAEGEVPVNTPEEGGFDSLKPTVQNLEISETGPESITLNAILNISNPTAYSATIPFVDVKFGANDTIIGHARAESVKIVPGDNANVTVQLYWEPGKTSGEEGEKVGREFLSQYLSGYNISMAFNSHEGSIPSQPSLGKALEKMKISLPMPRLGKPKDGDDGDDDDDDDKPHFIKEATMHIISSTAVFTLDSPLKHTVLFITAINATAYRNDTAVGRIEYDGSIAVPPGESETPRLPVAWTIDGDTVKKALGGSLRLGAVADLGIRIGKWHQDLWFRGGGIGTKIRL